MIRNWLDYKCWNDPSRPAACHVKVTVRVLQETTSGPSVRALWALPALIVPHSSPTLSMVQDPMSPPWDPLSLPQWCCSRTTLQLPMALPSHGPCWAYKPTLVCSQGRCLGQEVPLLPWVLCYQLWWWDRPRLPWHPHLSSEWGCEMNQTGARIWFYFCPALSTQSPSVVCLWCLGARWPLEKKREKEKERNNAMWSRNEIILPDFYMRSTNLKAWNVSHNLGGAVSMIAHWMRRGRTQVHQFRHGKGLEFHLAQFHLTTFSSISTYLSVEKEAKETCLKAQREQIFY